VANICKVMKVIFFKIELQYISSMKDFRLNEGGHYCLLGSGSGDSMESGSGSEKPG
jgi:hypothetical protein